MACARRLLQFVQGLDPLGGDVSLLQRGLLVLVVLEVGDPVDSAPLGGRVDLQRLPVDVQKLGLGQPRGLGLSPARGLDQRVHDQLLLEVQLLALQGVRRGLEEGRAEGVAPDVLDLDVVLGALGLGARYPVLLVDPLDFDRKDLVVRKELAVQQVVVDVPDLPATVGLEVVHGFELVVRSYKSSRFGPRPSTAPPTCASRP